MTAVLGLSVLAGVSTSVSAGDCRVAGWSERQPGQHPIFVCPDGRTVGWENPTAQAGACRLHHRRWAKGGPPPPRRRAAWGGLRRRAARLRNGRADLGWRAAL